MPYYGNIREEELKLKVGEEWFADFDHTAILGNIDYCVSRPLEQACLFDFGRDCFLWAEAKRGTGDLDQALAQLVLTIGKERTFEKNLPPALLAAFNADGIQFIPYHAVMDIFYQNDFNWNVTPSDHHTREFQQLAQRLAAIPMQERPVFRWKEDAAELRRFIKANFRSDHDGLSRLRITKSNFVSVFLKWMDYVKPTIGLQWQAAAEHGLIPADFYLADLLSEKNQTIPDKLNVLLHTNRYIINRHIDHIGAMAYAQTDFSDDGKAHAAFWSRYERPPKREYWSYIIERRDLLVPQDIRERKGSYFTPQQWVEKAHEYLANALGENWQDTYIVWDCCAGTGNLEVGLVNKYNVFASTLDKSDVDIMKERAANGAALVEGHIFQFDFLNGDFRDLPKALRDTIGTTSADGKEFTVDPEKCRRLVVLINPPYAEHGNARQRTGTGKNKSGVAISTKVYSRAKEVIGAGARELFVQFLYRIYKDLPGCIIAQFSKLKHLQGQNFAKFRSIFQPRLLWSFLVPANTFDNVNGNFPIGFFIWDTAQKAFFQGTSVHVYDAKGNPLARKRLANPNLPLAIKWIQQFYDDQGQFLAYLRTNGSDVQNNTGLFLTLSLSPNDKKAHFFMQITEKNLLPFCVYFTARKCIEHTWLNDRDQYLWPQDGCLDDTGFVNDCLAYVIFSRSNLVKSADGVNHWIPFAEAEVGARARYASHALLDILTGNHRQNSAPQEEEYNPPFAFLVMEERAPYNAHAIAFSPEATAVFHAARELWCHYHRQPDALPDASFYEIREFFQGRDEKGILKPDSPDATYNALAATFRAAYQALEETLVPRVYHYGFLLQ